MKKILPTFLLVIFMLCSKEFIFAEKITILYTGDTHAALYPCNCPKAPYGGVARRTTLIKELRKNGSDFLLLDSGSFFAGGIYDKNRLNVESDKKRTTVNIEAMDFMDYDAVAIGANELNFGKSFLEDIIKKTRINFLSCNTDLKGVHPFVIKEVNGVKIGILAVMPQTEELQYALDIASPLVSLKHNIKKLKDVDVDLIILLSQLGEKNDIGLILTGLDVDIVIAGADPIKKDIFTQVNSTILLRPPIREGRYLRRLQFEFENGKVDDTTIVTDELALSGDLADDPDISLMLPRCFSDKDCRRSGLIGRCKNPAEEDSECIFSEHTHIPLVIIEPSACSTCNTAAAVSALKDFLPGIRPSYLKSDTKKAKDIIKKFDIKMLPVYLLDKKAEKDERFIQLVDNGAAELKHDKYLINPSFIGVSYFVGREYIKDRIDLFIDLDAEGSKEVLSTIKKFLEEMQGEIDFNLHFLVVEKEDGEFYSRGGLPLIEEDKRCACIMRHYPDKWWDYILCRTDQIESSWWEDCISNENLNKELIKKCSQTDEGIKLLRDNIKLTEELKISYGPLLLLNNQEVFGITKETSTSELKRIVNPKNKGAKQ